MKSQSVGKNANESAIGLQNQVDARPFLRKFVVLYFQLLVTYDFLLKLDHRTDRRNDWLRLRRGVATDRALISSWIQFVDGESEFGLPFAVGVELESRLQIFSMLFSRIQKSLTPWRCLLSWPQILQKIEARFSNLAQNSQYYFPQDQRMLEGFRDQAQARRQTLFSIEQNLQTEFVQVRPDVKALPVKSRRSWQGQIWQIRPGFYAAFVGNQEKLPGANDQVAVKFRQLLVDPDPGDLDSKSVCPKPVSSEAFQSESHEHLLVGILEAETGLDELIAFFAQHDQLLTRKVALIWPPDSPDFFYPYVKVLLRQQRVEWVCHDLKGLGSMIAIWRQETPDGVESQRMRLKSQLHQLEQAGKLSELLQLARLVVESGYLSEDATWTAVWALTRAGKLRWARNLLLEYLAKDPEAIWAVELMIKLEGLTERPGRSLEMQQRLARRLQVVRQAAWNRSQRGGARS